MECFSRKRKYESESNDIRLIRKNSEGLRQNQAPFLHVCKKKDRNGSMSDIKSGC